MSAIAPRRHQMDPLELELQAVVSHSMRVLGTEFVSFARVVCDLTAEPSPARGHTFGGLLALCL